MYPEMSVQSVYVCIYIYMCVCVCRRWSCFHQPAYLLTQQSGCMYTQHYSPLQASSSTCLPTHPLHSQEHQSLYLQQNSIQFKCAWLAFYTLFCQSIHGNSRTWIKRGKKEKQITYCYTQVHWDMWHHVRLLINVEPWRSLCENTVSLCVSVCVYVCVRMSGLSLRRET